ncbi:MAG: hypothetical protein HZA54_16665 [Planctomycetes bacterium]|nr:hypothetical protein [Planctomycetota bacterium]
MPDKKPTDPKASDELSDDDLKAVAGGAGGGGGKKEKKDKKDKKEKK